MSHLFTPNEYASCLVIAANSEVTTIWRYTNVYIIIIIIIKESG